MSDITDILDDLKREAHAEQNSTLEKEIAMLKAERDESVAIVNEFVKAARTMEVKSTCGDEWQTWIIKTDEYHRLINMADKLPASAQNHIEYVKELEAVAEAAYIAAWVPDELNGKRIFVVPGDEIDKIMSALMSLEAIKQRMDSNNE